MFRVLTVLTAVALATAPITKAADDTQQTTYDTFVSQLVADAQAAVAKAVEIGVTDAERIGVIGHSHGGLMVANLLAHTDLFRAGIARSGSYNKTNQPFGFQSEVFFEAVRGSGGTARLVLLPFEDHGYRARESIQHVLHEQIKWFDEHVKNAESRIPPPTAPP